MTMQHSEDFKALSDDARTRVPEITTDEVNTLIDNGQCPILVDVREQAEFIKSHLPNAYHLGRGIIEIHIHKLANKDTPIILYCGGGNRSLLAGDNLKKMGYENVRSMEGGFRKWLSQGYVTVSED